MAMLMYYVLILIILFQDYVVTTPSNYSWIPPTVAALCGLIVSIVNSRKANTIHELVNSNWTELKSEFQSVKTELATSRAEVDALKQNVAQLIEKKTITK